MAGLVPAIHAGTRNADPEQYTGGRRETRCSSEIVAPVDDDRGREGFRLPSLRTVRAVLPHTALQSLVSSSGVSRCCPGRALREQSRPCEDGRLAAFDAVTQRRHHAIGPRETLRSACCDGVPVADLSSVFSHKQYRRARCITPDLSHPTSCLPSHRNGFASRPSHRSKAASVPYEGSDSRRSHAARRVSPLTPLCRPTIPIPTTRSVQGSLCQSSQRPRSFQASPSSSRLATGTRRIRFVLLQTGSSPPVAPHPGLRRRSYLQLHGYDTP
jgi:hypothetical protein